MARIALSTHWKFLRLARSLESRPLARGVLETLWEPCWQAGDPYLGTSADIEAVCEWRGKSGALTQALLTAGGSKGAGFIEPYEGDVRDTSEPHYQVHDFFDHCPEYVRRRRKAENGAYPRQCLTCGEEFFAQVPHAQFCKHACRQAAYRGEVTEGRDAGLRHAGTRPPSGISGKTPSVTQDVTQALRGDAKRKPSQAKPSQAVRTCVANSAATKNRVAPLVADVPGLEVDDDDGLAVDDVRTLTRARPRQRHGDGRGGRRGPDGR